MRGEVQDGRQVPLILLTLSGLKSITLPVDEGFGNGIKALGTNGQMHYLKVHDNRISVVPNGTMEN